MIELFDGIILLLDGERELLISLLSLLNLILSFDGIFDRLGEVTVELLLLVFIRVVAFDVGDLGTPESLDWRPSCSPRS